ncbi:hypothetical protein [Palleronia pelagia]|uniref:Uncharacterized protein n=1 Tax=Palleronia pelagia TaxID=387096 RepID=A0A1H8HFA7_9RHOB|nr:hypothetical protein [Palleronia pelagia]SEN54258.1 hypothetical protein SAMN04488011_104401 [Palleronia pelagia]
MDNIQTIRCRRDGSIDTAHDIRKGRAQRSQAAHDLGKVAARSARKPIICLAAIVALLPFIGTQT